MLAPCSFGLAGAIVVLLGGVSFTVKPAERASFTVILKVAKTLAFWALCGGGYRV